MKTKKRKIRKTGTGTAMFFRSRSRSRPRSKNRRCQSLFFSPLKSLFGSSHHEPRTTHHALNFLRNPRLIIPSLLATVYCLLLFSLPAHAYIDSVSNTPDPFDNQVAGQTTYLQATPEDGSSAFPNTGEWYADKWDMTLEILDSGGNIVRRLWSFRDNKWPNNPNGDNPPMWDGYSDWDRTSDARGSALAYGTYTGKLYQGTTAVYSTKVPTLFLMGNPTDISIDSAGTIWVVNDSTQRVIRYSADGVMLVQFEVTPDSATSRLHGLAVSVADSAVYVGEYVEELGTDCGNDRSRIQKFNLSGTLIDDNFIPCGGNPDIKQIEGLDLDSNGDIYVSEFKDKKVLKFPKAGGDVNPTLDITLPGDTCNQGSYPVRDVAVDTNGDIYIVDGQNQGGNKTNDRACIAKYDSTGSRLWTKTQEIRPADTGGTECNPHGIAVDGSYVYVSCGCDSDTYLVRDDDPDLACGNNSHTVLVYNKSTRAKVSEFGTAGAPGDATGTFNVPHAIEVDTANNWVYVSESANNRIKKLSESSGTLSYLIHIDDPYSTPNPTGIDIDSAGNVYVGLQTSGLIKKFDSDGNLKCTLGGTGEDIVGKFSRLHGVAVSDDGTYLYAADPAEDVVEQYIMTDTSDCTGSWTDDGTWPMSVGQGVSWDRGPQGVAVQPGVAGSSAILFVVQDQSDKVDIFKPDGTAPGNPPYANSFNTSADPRGVAVDEQGYVFVTHLNGKVVKYDGLTGDLNNIDNTLVGYGIAVDKFGNIYQTDRGDADDKKGDNVHKYGNYVKYNQATPGNETHELKWQMHFRGYCDPGSDTCDPPSATDGKFHDPWGIAVAQDGSYVWVSDYANNRIQKFNITYKATLTDDITIGSATDPPDVSAVSISPASPVPAGQLQVNVNYNKSMQVYNAPDITVLTQNNCPLTVYDEAVITDADSGGTYNAGDSVLAGVAPVLDTALVAFRNTDPMEGFIEFPIGGAGDSTWDSTDGEPIVGTLQPPAPQDQKYKVGEDEVYFATQTTPSGIPTDIDGKDFDLFSADARDIRHTDNGPTAGYYDGYFVTNQWKGWVTIPSGTTACCGGSCDGTAQVKVENGKDAAGTVQNPTPWDCNSEPVDCFQFIIDTTDPTEPVITVPSDDDFTSLNSVQVEGSYNDTNGKEVTVVTTDFSCIVREDSSSLNNTYNSGTDTLIRGSCADGTVLIPMTTKEGWIDNATGTANSYDNGEPIIGNYYDITPGTELYDQGTEPCSNCDRVLVDLGSYNNLDTVLLFSEKDSNVKTNRVSYQTVTSTGNFTANNVGLPSYTVYYISAVAKDNAGNESPYTSKRVKITRGSGNPGVASISPSTIVAVDSTGVWTVSYTSATAYDYPADSGDCACGTTPSTDANCYVTVTVPTGWVAPTETPATDGVVSVATGTQTTLCPTDTFSVSGQQIKVHIDSMNAGETFNVSYGYSAGGAEVTNLATLGGNTFAVKARNFGDTSDLSVPPETVKTLTVPVEGLPTKVSHTANLPATIYDFSTNIQVMGLNFENTNSSGSGKSQKISLLKMRYVPSGTQTAQSVISRVVVKSGTTEHLNTTNISGITDADNIMTLNLSPVAEAAVSSVKPLDVYMDFQEVSVATPALTSLEFLLDGDADYATDTSDGLTSTVLTDNGASWATNTWVSYTLIPDITSPNNSYIVKSNTPTTITIRSGDMTGDGATAGDTYAVGDASTAIATSKSHVEVKDGTTSSDLKAAPRTGSVVDTFYPDYNDAGAEMSSGEATQFKPPPIGNHIVVTKSNSWTTGQNLSKGQTSSKPYTLKFRLVDQVVESTNTGEDCAGCTTVFVEDAEVFSGLVGSSFIIGDDDGSQTRTISSVDTGADSITFTPSVTGTLYRTKNMYVMRDGASAKISKIVFTVYACEGEGCTPVVEVDDASLGKNPAWLIDRLALRETGTSNFYVNKTSSQIETSGSTITLDLSTRIQLSGATAENVDVLLDLDSSTTARRMKLSITAVTAIYPNSRKPLTSDCTACGSVYFNNSVAADIVANERLFITEDGASGEWETISPPEYSDHVDTFISYTGTYNVAAEAFVEHTKIKAGFLSAATQTFPLDSIVASIVNAAALRVNKIWVYDQADPDTPLCELDYTGAGATTNPEVLYGSGLNFKVELENTASDPAAIAYVDAKNNDLSFIRKSDYQEYSSEFTVTPPGIKGGGCVYAECINRGATATIQYSLTQDSGTTLAPTADSDYFFIDIATSPLFVSPDCDENKTGRYHPLTYDSNDYVDTDKFCVNDDSDGVQNFPTSEPNFCRISIKSSPAYAKVYPVSVQYVGAGSTDILVSHFTVHDGPGDNAGQVMTQLQVGSNNATDTDIRLVELWKDDGDAVFEPYHTNNKRKQIIIQDCNLCTELKVNDASLFSVSDNVTVCHDSACTTSDSRTVSAVNTTTSPETITLNSAITANISYYIEGGSNPEAYVQNDTKVGGDEVIDTATFSGGIATFTGINPPEGDIPDAGSVRYFVSYDIETVLDTSSYFSDGDIIDAFLKAQGTTFADNPASVDPIPGSDLNSAGQSNIDIVAVDIEADPPNSQSCIDGERQITFRAHDAFDNTDNGSYGNPVTHGAEIITVTFTQSEGGESDPVTPPEPPATGDSVDFTSSSLAGAVYSPENPPGDADSVQGNLASGIGTATLTDSDVNTPPELVTISAASSLDFEPSGGATTNFGNNVCLTALDVTGTEQPAAATDVLIINLKLTNGLAETIEADTIQVDKTANQTATDSEILRVELWYDSDDSESFSSAGDTSIANGTFSNGSLTFSGLTCNGGAAGECPITATARKEYFFLTYDLQNEITDGDVLDAQAPINGFTWSTPTASYTLDSSNVSDSAGTSKVNIDADELYVFPQFSTSTLTADCNDCTTVSVSDVSVFTVGEEVLIDDDDSEATTSLYISSVSPSGATQTTAGTVALTAPATGSYTTAQNAFLSNTPNISRQVTVRAIDNYGNIASDPSNTSYEASEQVKLEADNNAFPPDSALCTVLTVDDLTDIVGGGVGETYVEGKITSGDGQVTWVENSCQPRRVKIIPSTGASGYTTYSEATLRFPGDWAKDTTAPEAATISFAVSGGCIATSTPEIDVISGTDDCSGISAMRFSCVNTVTAIEGAEWVPIEPPQMTADVCCNCIGDSRDVGCGFDLVTGNTCAGGYTGGSEASAGPGNCTTGWKSNASDDCSAAQKVVYIQFKDRKGNESAFPDEYTDPPVVIDVVTPVLNSYYFSSDAESYFLGSADYGICDSAQTGVGPPAFDGDNSTQPHLESEDGLISTECPLWYSNKVEATQTLTIQLNYDETGSTTTFRGSAAFGEPLQTTYGATGSGVTVSLDYDVDSTDGTAATTSVTFELFDSCNNGATETFEFYRDVTGPDMPTTTGYDNVATTTVLTSGSWYNYTNPYFEWATGSDLPTGTPYYANADLRDYEYEFSTDSGAPTAYSTSSTSFSATGPLESGWPYYLRFLSYDNVNNATNTTTTFTYKFDDDPPDNPAVSGWATDGQNTAVASGSWYNYATPTYSWAGATDLPATGPAPLPPENAGFNQFNLYWGDDITGTVDYATAGFSTDTVLGLTSGYYYYLRMSSDDNAGNATTTSQVFVYGYDSTPPDNPAVSGWATDGQNTAIASGSWYNYATPTYTWAGATDLPASPPADGNAGFNQFNLFWGDDIAGAVDYATAGYSTDTVLGLTSGYTYYLRMSSDDNAGNATTTSQVFVYKYDSTPPDNPAVSGWATDGQNTSLTDGSWYNYAAPSFSWAGATDLPAAPANSGFKQFNLYWGSDSNGTPDYATTAFATDTVMALATGTTYYLRMSCEDNAGNATTTTTVFTYRYDPEPPVIQTSGLSESSDYLWTSSITGKLYYGLGMGSAQSFTVSGTATDTYSGLATASFSPAFNDTPADDTSPLNWSGSYDIEASNTTAATITVTVYDTAGNTAATEAYTVQNNNLYIEYSTMTPPYLPTFVQFQLYYPDYTEYGTYATATKMAAGYSGGMYATVTGGVDTSAFIHAYRNDGVERTVYDDANDSTANSFIINTLQYLTSGNCGSVSGANSWCLEVYTSDCVTGNNPHYLGASGTFSADGFNTVLPIEETIDGDLGAAVTPTVNDGDDGTFEARSGPDYMVVKPQDDGLILADTAITSWCAGGGCSPACSANYCSALAAPIGAIPDFVKYNGTALTYDGSGPDAAGEWDYDSTNGRVELFDDPTGATVTYTTASGSEQVCAYLYDACDQLIDSGKWHDAPARLTLSQAPDSGKDITRNDVSGGVQGFASVSDPAGGDFSPSDQLTIKGLLDQGKACITLTAENAPSDDPQTPIKVGPVYFNEDTGATTTLTQSGGTDTPGFVLISPSEGIAYGTMAQAGFASWTNVFNPDYASYTQELVLSPAWSNDGDQLSFISRQANPCGCDNAVEYCGEAPYDDFNIYTVGYDTVSQTWPDCMRITKNSYEDPLDPATVKSGVAAWSEVTWAPSNDKIIFAAEDTENTGREKLFWVSVATSTVGAATGTYYNAAPTEEYKYDDGSFTFDGLHSAGTDTINIKEAGPYPFATDSLVYFDNFANSETKRVASISGQSMTIVDPDGSAGTGLAYSYDDWDIIGLQSLLGYGQMISSTDTQKWYDPNWSPDVSYCTATYRDKLMAVRAPASNGSNDYAGTPWPYTSGGNGSPNILYFSGTKNSDGLYAYGVSTINRVTNFTNCNPQPLKPKWSPDCEKIAFIAWDTGCGACPCNPTPPSETDVYMIDLASATLPVTSLTDTGVYKVYDYDTNSKPAYYPNWSADATVVTYAVDDNNALDIEAVNVNYDTLVDNIFGAADFDNYLEYVEDQSAADGAVIAPQIFGRASYNEFGMVQCPGNYADTKCPNGPNFPFTYVAHLVNYGDATGALRIITLRDESYITANGGLLFQDGIVTAVFPPGVVASDTVFYNTWPTPYCSGGAAAEDDGGGGAGALGGVCAEDPTNDDFIVSFCDPAGTSGGNCSTARDYFPDGTNFKEYVRLIFHYCDNDSDGYVDAQTEGRGYYYSGGLCYTDAAYTTQTSGGTIDEDSLAAFYWDATQGKWIRLDGVIDKTNNTLTVFASHFTSFETLGFRYGLQAGELNPLRMVNIHTYPNPWHSTMRPAQNIRFNADLIDGDREFNITVRIYDIRGREVRTLSAFFNNPADVPADVFGGRKFLEWDGRNNAGRDVASGVYLYYLYAVDGAGYKVTKKDKIAVIH